MRDGSRFWWGFLAGLASTLLVATGWAAWAVFRVDRNLDQREQEWHFARTRIALPAPELRTSDLGGMGYGWQMMDVRNGMPLDGSSLRGKVLFVNLWDPGCLPCRAEFGSIAALSERPELAGVQFLSPVNGRANEVREFLAHSEVSVPGRVLLAERAVPAAFAVDALPTTLIVDREGRIVVREVGAADWNDQRVADLLLELSSSPPSPAADGGAG